MREKNLTEVIQKVLNRRPKDSRRAGNEFNELLSKDDLFRILRCLRTDVVDETPIKALLCTMWDKYLAASFER